MRCGLITELLFKVTYLLVMPQCWRQDHHLGMPALAPVLGPTEDPDPHQAACCVEQGVKIPPQPTSGGRPMSIIVLESLKL